MPGSGGVVAAVAGGVGARGDPDLVGGAGGAFGGDGGDGGADGPGECAAGAAGSAGAAEALSGGEVGDGQRLVGEHGPGGGSEGDRALPAVQGAGQTGGELHAVGHLW